MVDDRHKIKHEEFSKATKDIKVRSKFFEENKRIVTIPEVMNEIANIDEVIEHAIKELSIKGGENEDRANALDDYLYSFRGATNTMSNRIIPLNGTIINFAESLMLLNDVYLNEKEEQNAKKYKNSNKIYFKTNEKLFATALYHFLFENKNVCFLVCDGKIKRLLIKTLSLFSNPDLNVPFKDKLFKKRFATYYEFPDSFSSATYNQTKPENIYGKNPAICRRFVNKFCDAYYKHGKIIS
jgi:hypothetical protein